MISKRIILLFRIRGLAASIDRCGFVGLLGAGGSKVSSVDEGRDGLRWAVDIPSVVLWFCLILLAFGAWDFAFNGEGGAVGTWDS